MFDENLMTDDRARQNIFLLDRLNGVPPEAVKLRKNMACGGVSELWFASHESYPGTFLVKYSKFSSEDNNYILGQFEREYEVSKTLFNRGIYDASAHVCDFDVDAMHHPYIYLEYFKSIELTEVMMRCFEWRCLRMLFRRISEKLGSVHRVGIVHRDIKPSNILVSQTGDVRLIDFSLATIDGNWHRYHEEGMALGTPLYMSPEQAFGRKIMLTSACDCYAIGVILFFWMTGHYPFQGQNAAETMKMHCYGPVPLPERCRITNAPAALPEICQALLSKEPNARFSAVNRFRDILCE